MQVASLVSGVQEGLALGEAPVTLVTPNLQVMIASALVSETGNSVLTTPPTEKQTAYESIQPKITLGPQGLSACASSPWSNYAEYSLVQWGVNPYATLVPIQSTLLRFSSVNPAYTPPSAMTQRNVQKKTVAFSVNAIPAYTIALQFTTVQQFNFTAAMDYSAKSKSTPNFTLPACTQYDGKNYVPCKSCNISSYTNYNVTYSCYDIEQLCPRSSTQRRLSDGEQYVSDLGYHIDLEREGFNNDDEDMNEIEKMYEIEDENEDEGDSDGEDMNEDEGEEYVIIAREEADKVEGKEFIVNEEQEPIPGYHRHRMLEKADDDNVKTNIADTSATFGVLMQTVNAQLTTVLSTNPFTLKAKENTAILTLVGCLSGGILIMLIFLRRLDQEQNVMSKYIKKEKEAMKKKSFEKMTHKEATCDLEVLHKRREEFQRSKSTMNMLGNIRHSSLSEKCFSSSFGIKMNKRTSSRCSTQMSMSFVSTNSDTDRDRDRIFDTSKARASLLCGSEVSESIDDIDEDSDSDSQGLTADSCYSDDKHSATSAVVEEFLHKVFSGRSIFKKDWNAWRIIHANHSYLKTIGTPTIGSSRVIRFLGLMSQIMIILLLDTLFFGIFYPRAAPCTFTTDKVNT